MAIGKMMEVILYADDMARLVAFYRDQMGLTVEYPQCDDYSDQFWVVFETGSCKLCLHGGGERKQGADAAKIVFHVDDIHRGREFLTGRGVELSEVRNPAPGVYVCDGKDPAGNPFSIESASGH